MITRTCRYCGEDYPADEPDLWSSTNQCRDCHNRACREREARRSEERTQYSKVVDPMIAPARVHLTVWSSCYSCSSCDECRTNVQNGRQVLCAPVYASDLLIEKAYMARKEMAKV